MHHNYAGAIEWDKKAAEMSPQSENEIARLQQPWIRLQSNGDLISARENLQKAVQVDPEFVGAWISLGVMAQRTGELPLAVQAYSRAVQLHPTDYGYLLLAGALWTPPARKSRLSLPGKKRNS